MVDNVCDYPGETGLWYGGTRSRCGRCVLVIVKALASCVGSGSPVKYVKCVFQKVKEEKESCKPCICNYICKHKPKFCSYCNR